MLQLHVNSRLGERCFGIEVSPESRQFLLGKGVSEEYGARELKRTIHRELTQPLATMVARGQIGSGARVNVSLSADGNHLVIEASDAKAPATTQRRLPLSALAGTAAYRRYRMSRRDCARPFSQTAGRDGCSPQDTCNIGWRR